MQNSPAQQCPECSGAELYETVIAPNGMGITLLPALSGFMQAAQLKLVLCQSCGLLRMYASQSARERLADSSTWSRVVAENV